MTPLPPNRVAQVIEDLEAGRSVDTQQIALLQALDIANYGRRYVEEVFKRGAQTDERAVSSLKR